MNTNKATHNTWAKPDRKVFERWRRPGPGPTNKFGPSMLLPNSRCFAVIQKKSVMTAHSFTYQHMFWFILHCVYSSVSRFTVHVYKNVRAYNVYIMYIDIRKYFSSSQMLAIHLECNQSIQAIRHRSTETLSQDLYPASKTYTQHYLMTPPQNILTGHLVGQQPLKTGQSENPQVLQVLLY